MSLLTQPIHVQCNLQAIYWAANKNKNWDSLWLTAFPPKTRTV